MKILFAASEAAPYVKSGGLGDVMEALPSELAKNDDVEVSVFLPYYKSIKSNPRFNLEFVTSFSTMLSWRQTHVGIFKSYSVNKKVTYYFIDNEYYFNRDGSYYGYYDDGERFAYFSKAILESLHHLNYYPDIIHLNDWQTAAIPVLLKAFYAKIPDYSKIKTVFTIHNIEYQGKMPMEFLTEIMGFSNSWKSVMKDVNCNCINFMKSAILLSDKITTVSKTYSYEIRHPYFSHGLDTVLKENEDKLIGIVNGINTKIYNPRTDKHLPFNYSSSDLLGKAACKKALQQELNLPVRNDVPIISLITRLVSHKGLDLIECVLSSILNMDVQLVVEGTGDQKYEDMFKFSEYNSPNKMAAVIKFDSDLASRIYAGSDLFLMPSKSEPCGLAQLIAMRYGTIPIVRETGGLVDTVPPLNIDTLEGKGFTFKLFNAHDMLNAIERAVSFWHNESKREEHIKNLIKYDSSWKNPVWEYMNLYSELVK
ncbi:MAG: glycogen synthase GlgA [Bacillota bacterium]|nr:glycogen synthase GlgA [Bacillota bacterium]